MNREKVIKGLEICKPSKYSRTCGICPYREEMNCDYEVYNDALAMLKKQGERIKDLEHQLETLTKWRMNAGAFD